MRRGPVLKIGAAVIVIVLTGSSAWGAETWQQLNVSRGSFESTRNAAQALLFHASRAGLSRSAVRSFRARISGTAVGAPSSPQSWRDAIDRYDRAKQSLLAIETRIRTELRRETVEQRVTTVAVIRSLDAAIKRAATYDVDTRNAEAAYARLEISERRSNTRAGLALVARFAKSEQASFDRAAAPAESFVDNLMKSAGDSKAEVLASAQSAARAIDANLALLGILTTRAASYHTEESADFSAVQLAPTAFHAAVAAYKLDLLRSTVAADSDKTIPAKLIVVSTEQQEVTLYQNGRSIFSTVATTGGPELPTDHGVFHIYEKISPFVFHSPFPPSSPYYYYPSPVTYWMPFDGGQGLHDAPWRSNFGPGSNLEPTDLGGGRSILGTHGCVNLPFDAAQYVWNWAPLGTTVAVI